MLSSFILPNRVTFVIDPGTSRSISLHKTAPSLRDALRNPSGSAMFFLGELRTPREMSQVTVCSSGFIADRAPLLQHTGHCALLLLLLPTSATLLLCGTAFKTSSKASALTSARGYCTSRQPDLSKQLHAHRIDLLNCCGAYSYFKCEKMLFIASFILRETTLSHTIYSNQMWFCNEWTELQSRSNVYLRGRNTPPPQNTPLKSASLIGIDSVPSEGLT